MKNTILLIILGISINVFGQSNRSVFYLQNQNSIEYLRTKMGNNELVPSNIFCQMNYSQNIQHQIFDKRALIDILDSSYKWQWDLLNKSWKYDSKNVNYTFDSKNNGTSYLTQNWNGISWVNEYRYYDTYDANNNSTGFLVQNWNGSSWVNFLKVTNTYEKNYLSHYLFFCNFTLASTGFQNN